jgi:hypothetical protein
VPATYTTSVDWNDDGDFSDLGENVSGRVLDPPGFSSRYGRDRARALSPMAAGEAAFELDNFSRDYSPDNASSPLFGNVLPGREVYGKATLSAVDYGLFRGHIDDFDVRPDVDRRAAAITCLDPIARLREIRISTPIFQSVRSGDAIHAILDAAEWPADKRDIDYGVSFFPWFWLNDTDAYTALQQVVDSEGPPALATVDPNGNVVFRDRHHRLLRAASITSQATFRDDGTEPCFSPPAVYDHGLRDIVNTVAFNVPLRRQAVSREVVWSTTSHLDIADGQTRALSVSASNPFVGALTPEAGTDYILRSGAITVWLSADSGQAVTVYIQATGGPAVIDDLQLRAYPVQTLATWVIGGRDTGSINRYGRRSWPSQRDPVWAGVHDADAIADIILGRYAERLPTVTITLKSSTISAGTDVRLLQQLSRDLSDRVHLVETQTGLDDDCYLETIEHDIGGSLHTTRFGCEKASTPLVGVFRFDTTGAGFNDGVFAVTGVSETASMFRFDTAGQGFNDGLFAF